MAILQDSTIWLREILNHGRTLVKQDSQLKLPVKYPTIYMLTLMFFCNVVFGLPVK